MNQVINGGCHASRNWNAHRSAPQKVQWHGQSDAPIALVPLTKVAESASHFIVTSPHIPFLQIPLKIKDQGSQSAWTTKLLRKSLTVSLFMMNQGTRGTWGCRFYNVNVAKACRNEEKMKKHAFWRPTATYSCLFQQETELHIAPDKETLWFIACCVSWTPWKMMPFSFSEKAQFDDNCVNFTWKKRNKTKPKDLWTGWKKSSGESSWGCDFWACWARKVLHKQTWCPAASIFQISLNCGPFQTPIFRSHVCSSGNYPCSGTKCGPSG